MNSSNEDLPFDKPLITVLVSYADKFELAVRAGQDIVAAAVARAIVQCLRRFSPIALASACSTQIGWGMPPRFLTSLSGPSSSPDGTYLAIVRPAMKEFKEALISGSVDGAIKALGPTGLLAAEDSPQNELRELERKLARVSGVRRLEFLPQAAKLAFWTGDTKAAEEYAAEALRLERSHGPSGDGEATHDGNMVLGLVALEHGNTERAKMHLLESTNTNVSGSMRMTGPNLSLASELLKRNEHEVVISYLQECKRFWIDGRNTIDAWIETIRNSENPKFDPLHLSM
jgi:hypothetical protein